jgi:hypothetical protein
MGVGLIIKPLQGGGVWQYICDRCAGSQNDVIVKFR